MEYPILIEGKEAGLLRVSQEGLYTVFEGWMTPSQELTRLWVAGEGKSACLGLMEPRKEERYLRRKLTRADMRDFPDRIEYAATAEPAQTVEVPAPVENQDELKIEEKEEAAEAEDDDGPPAATGPPRGTGEDGLLWFPRPDGSLCAFDGAGLLVAFPIRLRCRTRGLRLRVIDGREYMVFRY